MCFMQIFALEYMKHKLIANIFSFAKKISVCTYALTQASRMYVAACVRAQTCSAKI